MLAGVAIYYTVDDSLSIETVQKAGALTAKWSLIAHIRARAAAGNADYRKLLATYEESKFTASALTCIWNRSYSTALLDYRYSVTRGTFQWSEEREEKFLRYRTQLLEIAEISPMVLDRAKASDGLLALLSHPAYEHRRFMDKLNYLSTRLVACASSEEYAELAFAIYNHRQSSESILSPGRKGNQHTRDRLRGARF